MGRDTAIEANLAALDGPEWNSSDEETAPSKKKKVKGARKKKSGKGETSDSKKAGLLNHGEGGLDASSVIYMGHLPAMFEETELRGFLSQFGQVSRLKLSRSRKTANSRCYCFVEFSDPEVASIVADTMSGYLMGQKRIVCHLVPTDKVHPNMFRRWDRAFKKIDWSARHREKVNQTKTEERMKAITTKLLRREQKKRKKLKAMGIDYDDFPGYNASNEKFPVKEAPKEEIDVIEEEETNEESPTDIEEEKEESSSEDRRRKAESEEADSKSVASSSSKQRTKKRQKVVDNAAETADTETPPKPASKPAQNKDGKKAKESKKDAKKPDPVDTKDASKEPSIPDMKETPEQRPKTHGGKSPKEEWKSKKGGKVAATESVATPDSGKKKLDKKSRKSTSDDKGKARKEMSSNTESSSESTQTKPKKQTKPSSEETEPREETLVSAEAVNPKLTQSASKSVTKKRKKAKKRRGTI